MIRLIPVLCMTAILSGCASLSYPLAKCDGYSRRPLNRALWQWEENTSAKQEHSNGSGGVATPATAAYAGEEIPAPALAHLAVDASYQLCEGAS